MINEIKVVGKGLISIRESNESDGVMVVFIDCIPGERLLKKLYSVAHSIYLQHKRFSELLFGEKKIIQRAGCSKFYLGPHDFFQVNSVQNEKLIALVNRYLELSNSDKVLDAYCGVGTFSLNIARGAFQVIGIDSNSQTIKNAASNSILNGIKNCQFIAGRCEKVLLNLQTRLNSIIVDPPRSGLKNEFIKAILSISPEKIVYISCNPITLARDIKQFVLNDYKLLDIQPIDMFPQTSSVENIVLLQKI